MEIKEQIEIECKYSEFKKILSFYESKGYILSTFISWIKIRSIDQKELYCKIKFEKETTNE